MHALITSLGLLRPDSAVHDIGVDIEVLRPPLATTHELTAYHDKDYIDYLLDTSASDARTDVTLPHIEPGVEFGLEDVRPVFRPPLRWPSSSWCMERHHRL